MIKTIIKIATSIISTLILYFLILLVYLSITDYQPPKNILLDAKGKCSKPVDKNDTLRLISWNIGYAGLGADMDFFYENGKQVRCSKKQTNYNISKIKQFIQEYQAEFYFFQEVDIRSKRSYNINQAKVLSAMLKNHCYAFAKNYDVGFIPMPLLKPYGHVNAGLLSLSSFRFESANRHALDANYSWPKRTYLLDRCFLSQTINLDNNKKLILLNIHNSAFDDDGEIKKQELKEIRDFMLREYKKGNYVIAGGDWNQNPPAFKGQNFSNDYKLKQGRTPIDRSLFPPDWHFVFDKYLPTNRSLYETFNKSTTETDMIDFFLITPNVKVIEMKTIDQAFRYTDHHPVFLSFIVQ